METNIVQYLNIVIICQTFQPQNLNYMIDFPIKFHTISQMGRLKVRYIDSSNEYGLLHF